MLEFLNISKVFIHISLIIFGLLSLATLLNLTLLKIKKENETLKKVKVIIRSWWLIAMVVILFGVGGAYGYLALFTVLTVYALREYFCQSQLGHLKKYLITFSTFFIFIEVFFLLFNQFEAFLGLPVIYFLMTFPIILFDKAALDKLPQVIASYMFSLFVSFSLLHLPALFLVGNQFFGSLENTIIVFFLILGLTEINDVLQFIFGKSFGKNKIVPHLSPNKTEAGFIGAIISVSLLSGFLFNQFIELEVGIGMLLGFLISIYGILGDLTFSAIKRYFGTKDFSNALPGHGGLLDRMDSIIFTAPILFYTLKIFLNVNL